MNKQEGDILSILREEPYTNQRLLSEISGHSLGIVNRSLKNLRKEGYLDEGMQLTEKAKSEFRKKAPRNAVILADGFGMRTGFAGTETPRGLLEVQGELLIERTLDQLRQAGIGKVYVVVGFLKERYEYLIDTYGVELIINPDYASGDTLYSMLPALPYLSNTYIIPCDVWCGKNPYHSHELYSWYMVSDSEEKESTVRVNRKMELVSVPGGRGGNAVAGIAYLLEEQAAIVRKRVMELCQTDRHVRSRKIAWEMTLYGKDRMMIPAKVAHRTEVVRIHTLEQLHRLESPASRISADALAASSRFLGAPPEKMVDLASLKKGISDHIFLFSDKGRKYILQMPEEGIKQWAAPGQEAQVYASISGKGFCEHPVYISPDGCRIMDFPENARSCDPMNIGDLEKCMALLRHLHEMELKVDHEADIFGLITYYENLWAGKPSLYKDYEKTKENVLSLKPYIDSQEKQKILTHMDTAPEKFIFIDREGGEELQLMGWEYAGMQDPHVDIAMFCVASLYDRIWTDKLISIYFGGNCPDGTRRKIYCYMAVCGLLRSNWCEYRMKQGKEFGEYSLRQYRYAKEYYRVAEE